MGLKLIIWADKSTALIKTGRLSSLFLLRTTTHQTKINKYYIVFGMGFAHDGSRGDSPYLGCKRVALKIKSKHRLNLKQMLPKYYTLHTKEKFIECHV